jgi:hypothetical protein
MSEQEKQSIALYLSPLTGERAGARDPDVNAIWGPSSAQMPMDGPMCTDNMAALDLSQPQWNGWSVGPDNARYQANPGFTVDEILCPHASFFGDIFALIMHQGKCYPRQLPRQNRQHLNI